MAEVAPRVAVVAVVLAHGAPLALREVRPPLPPGDAGARLFQPRRFGGARGSFVRVPGEESPSDEQVRAEGGERIGTGRCCRNVGTPPGCPIPCCARATDETTIAVTQTQPLA